MPESEIPNSQYFYLSHPHRLSVFSGTQRGCRSKYLTCGLSDVEDQCDFFEFADEDIGQTSQSSPVPTGGGVVGVVSLDGAGSGGSGGEGSFANMVAATPRGPGGDISLDGSGNGSGSGSGSGSVITVELHLDVCSVHPPYLMNGCV